MYLLYYRLQPTFPFPMNSEISRSASTDRTTHCSETSPGLFHDLRQAMSYIPKTFLIQCKIPGRFKGRNIMSRNNYTYILIDITGHFLSTILYYKTAESSQIHILSIGQRILHHLHETFHDLKSFLPPTPVCREILSTISIFCIIRLFY